MNPQKGKNKERENLVLGRKNVDYYFLKFVLHNTNEEK
jgi:hypothetical protein